MKKSLLAIAAMTAFAGAAQAQSSVTVYGILDVGVMGATNSTNINGSTWVVPAMGSYPAKGGNTNGSALGFMAGGESQSRLGFKGSEDLGGGTKAIFLLETGFNAGTGSIANTGLAGNKTSANNGGVPAGDTALQGQLFGRGAYAGLEGRYGTLTAGRQQNLMLDNIGGYDPVNAQMFSPINFSGGFGGGGATDDSRVNGALKYVYKTSNGFNVNAIYGPGGIAGNNTVGTTTGIQGGYESNKFGVQAIISHTSDAQSLSGNASPNTVNVTLENTNAYMLTGRYYINDKLTAKAGYERINITTPSNFQAYANTPVTVSGYSIGTLAAYAGPATESNNWWVGFNYAFTPVIKGSIGYYGISQLANGTVASGTTSIESAMVEYYLSKRTNLYAAVANGNFGGAKQITPNSGSTITNTIGNAQTYGIGMRHTF